MREWCFTRQSRLPLPSLLADRRTSRSPVLWPVCKLVPKVIPSLLEALESVTQRPAHLDISSLNVSIYKKKSPSTAVSGTHSSRVPTQIGLSIVSDEQLGLTETSLILISHKKHLC
ncbi:hypothetical protein NPIL_365381 [Nephila pilipes]|uniref:Uncharacterized protein n=1 Tax=Nephila pilipes TaxID=299642 RepID=A0A8X6QPB6_NEPPI|nr:hypothetical protein NPIL_365381 [Nephila pilipes]